MMKKINIGTKKYYDILWAWHNCNKGEDLEHAYRGKVSSEKRNSFKGIWFRAHQTEGYNDDLKITGASSWFYSTMYSFTQEGRTYVVYDTHANTYIIELED